MANADRPNGLKPVGTLGQADYDGRTRRMVVLAADTSDVAVGSPVQLSASGADSTGKYQAVTLGAAGGPFCGVVVSIEPAVFTDAGSDDLRNLYVVGTGTKDRFVMVDSDPMTMFEVQEDSVGGALAAADVGLNASLVFGGVDTTTGAAGVEIDSSTAATTAGLEVRLHGLVDREDNALGTNAKWLVTINDHQFANATAGV